MDLIERIERLELISKKIIIYNIMIELPFLQLKNNEFEIATFEILEMYNKDQTRNELYKLLSDDNNLKYIHELKIDSSEEIEMYVTGFKKHIKDNVQYTYFIKRIKSNSIIGEFILIPPKTVKDTYDIENVWFIQYILDSHYRDHGIMSQILEMILYYLKGKIDKIGAICDESNVASIKLLEKFDFKNIKIDWFDLEYYE